MLKKLQQISTEMLFQNPFWEYRKDRYIYPTGAEGDYFYVRTPGSVFIIPMINDKFVMIKQFRYLNQRESVEFPGGGIKKHLSIIENALKELEEETGYSSENIEFIGKFNPFHGVTDEYCHVFFAKNLYKVNAVTDESEEFEVLLITKNELMCLIKDNKIWDGMTLSAFSLFLANHENIVNIGV